MTTGVVETELYPLEVGGHRWDAVVAAAQSELADRGCTVLRDFIAPQARELLRRQCAELTPLSYSEEQCVNVYNTAPSDSLAPDDPGRIRMMRGNAFVARDDIPAGAAIHELYLSETFQALVAACLGVPRIYPLADPLAGLCINVVTPGKSHPWHFDTNEYAVSLLTQAPDSGGVFEYCPGIRSASAENFADVNAVLEGHGGRFIRRLELKPGDLQLFRGRYSLHRVKRVEGRVARHTAIFSYSDRPGVVGSQIRTRQLFGRLSPVHTGVRSRSDDLLD